MHLEVRKYPCPRTQFALKQFSCLCKLFCLYVVEAELENDAEKTRRGMRRGGKSGRGADGLMVGLDDLKGVFQP